MIRSYIENITYGNKGIVHITGTLAYVLASLADMRGPEPHASDFNPGSVTFVGMWSNVFIMVRSWLMKRGVEPASPHALSRRDMLYSLTHFSAFRKALIRSYFSI
jgi:hypothetical protein